MHQAYFILVGLLLPHLALSFSQAQLDRVFNRRPQRSAYRIASAPRHHRRYIQEPHPDVQQQEVQQKTSQHDDVESEIDLDKLIENIGSQTAPRMREKSTPAPSTSAPTGGYTPMPYYDTTKTTQMKDAEIPQMNPPQFADQEGFGEEFQQKYVPQAVDNSYGPMQQQHMEDHHQHHQQTYEQGGNGMTHKSPGMGHEDYEMHQQNVVDVLRNSVRGEPGRDYPMLSSIPVTSFRCADQPFPGYYADMETQCQVFHICQPDGRQDSFLCPNATIFSQRHFVCVWWYEFDCADSAQYYGMNAELYQEPPKQQKWEAPAQNAAPVNHEPIPTAAPGYGPGAGQGPAITETPPPSSRLSSPKDNLNKIYGHVAPMDNGGYMEGGPITTAAPMYYTPTGPRQSTSTTKGGSNNYRPSMTTKYEPSYGGHEHQVSVTPSPMETYETTPYNLDAALGEEKETPLIESLPLTTILPHVEQAVDLMRAINGHGAPNGYATKGGFTETTKANGMMEYYSTKAKYANGGVTSKPMNMYGGIKGNGNGKLRKNPNMPDSPAKNGRNGHMIHTQQPYNGFNTGNGLMSSSSNKNGNGYKAYGSVAAAGNAYGTKI